MRTKLKGVWSAASIFFGLIVGYVVAIPLGMVNAGKIAAIGKADWFGMPGQYIFALDFTSPAAISLIRLWGIFLELQLVVQTESQQTQN